MHVVEAPLAYQPDEIVRAVDAAMELRPDAVIVVPDGAAVLVLHHLQRRGLRVPDDPQLASYVDGPSLQIVHPSITALDIDPRLTGVAAVEALVGSILDEQAPSVRTEIPAVLQARESTAKA